MSRGEIRYAWSQEIALAYQIVGEGPVDLLYLQSNVSNVEERETTISGIAVNIGARIGARACPSEILASQTVKDLVAGSGLAFHDRGLHELKGVPDQRRLFAVATSMRAQWDGYELGKLARSSSSELPVLSGVEERISRPTFSASRPKSSSDR